MKKMSNKVTAWAVMLVSPLFTLLYFILGLTGCDEIVCAAGVFVSLMAAAPCSMIFDLVCLLDEEEA